MKYKNVSGQAIIEAIVALATILLILSAISVAVITSVNNSDFIRKQTLAKKAAEQGMEYIRYLRNNNPGSATVPGSFFSYASNQVQCMGGDNGFTAGSCANTVIDNTFKREVTFIHNDSQCDGGTKVTVRVSWASSKCSTGTFCHSSRLVSCFTNVPDSLKTL